MSIAANSILALLAFPFAALAFSPPSVIRSITILGSGALSPREVLAFMTSRDSTVFDSSRIASDLRSIEAGYRLRGYLGAEARLSLVDYSADSTLVDVSVEIREGRQTVIGSLTMMGARRLAQEDILSRFETGVGRPLDEKALEHDIDVLLDRYERRGFPFARCSVAAIAVARGDAADSLAISLALTEGERAVIDEIRVEGLRETDPDVVLREARVARGEPFDPQKVGIIRERLLRLNIFSAVSEPELYTRDGSSGLLLRVQEGEANTFDGILGYNPPPAPGEKGSVMGLLSISMRNLFGTGRKVGLRWQRDDRYSQEMQLRYMEPWILGWPVNVTGSFFQRQQDSSYVRREAGLEGDLMISHLSSLAATFLWQETVPSADSTLHRVSWSRTVSLGADFRYDSRDEPYNPASGTRLRAAARYGGKLYQVPTSLSGARQQSSIQHYELDLEFYFPAFDHHVGMVGIHARNVGGRNLDDGDMYRFGGTRSLRGFRENQFSGSLLSWSNAEYRLLLGRHSYLFGFFDAGYFSRPAENDRGTTAQESLQYGYGVGLAVETSLGILGISFALGKGESIAGLKVHFGLINDF